MCYQLTLNSFLLTLNMLLSSYALLPTAFPTTGCGSFLIFRRFWPLSSGFWLWAFVANPF